MTSPLAHHTRLTRRVAHRVYTQFVESAVEQDRSFRAHDGTTLFALARVQTVPAGAPTARKKQHLLLHIKYFAESREMYHRAQLFFLRLYDRAREQSDAR
ncbi:MAG: hypothetical protein ACJ8OJ_05005 [Povalibacter sp.]